MFGKRKQQAVAADQERFAHERDIVLRVLAQYPEDTKLSFGAPTRCPRCANFGLVESVDMATRVAQNVCVSCGTEWVITARALKAVRTQPAVRSPIPHLGTAPIHVAPGWDPAPKPVLITPAPSAPSREPLRVLHVEDDPADAAVVAELVRPAGDVIDLRTARDRSSGIAAAADLHPDIVLLDLGLPDSHGLQTIARWQFETAVKVPVVVLSGAYDLGVENQGRRLGVVDFLDKNDLGGYMAEGDSGSERFVDLLEHLAV